MKTDAIIIGAELDGLVAATRLSELGYSVRMFSTGAGSLHYAPDGIHVLGYSPSNNEAYVTSPFEAISQLDQTHPYQKIGAEHIDYALNWFAELSGRIHQRVTMNGHNKIAVSPAGLGLPVYGTSNHQALLTKLNVKNITIIRFRNYRDFPIDLIAAELSKTGKVINIVDADPPGKVIESAAIAYSFDALERPETYFSKLRDTIQDSTEIILFPAVMGFSRHKSILAAAELALGVPCLEVPTLLPSIPGMRLEQAFILNLENTETNFHRGVKIDKSSIDRENGIVVWDDKGRRFEAPIGILSSGGVLMGGLDIDSYSAVHETCFGLNTFQSGPLNTISVDQSLNALHIAGVETDSKLRPRINGSDTIPNLFITGRTLSHWNPSSECSTEGVCIATGWVAAENAHRYMEELNNE